MPEQRMTSSMRKTKSKFLLGLFTWENSSRHEFHTGMTTWFRIVLKWRHAWRWLRMRYPFQPTERSSHTKTRGYSVFTWHCCGISYRNEILPPVQKPGWTGTRMTFSGSIMWNERRATRNRSELAPGRKSPRCRKQSIAALALLVSANDNYFD